MNRIRAYFGRIQGRLAVAFMGVFVMAGIAYISMSLLGGYTGEIGDQMEALEALGNYALNLDAAISDQVSAAQDFLNSGREPAKLAADSLAEVAREINKTYIETPGIGPEVHEHLESIRATQAQLEAAFAQAQTDRAAGNTGAVAARVREMDRSMRTLRALIRALNTSELAYVGKEAAGIQQRAGSMQRLLLSLLAVVAILATIFAYFTM